MGLTARTAASFCVFLTLGLTFETAAFLVATLRAAGLAVAFRAGLTAFFGLAAVFFAGRAFKALRAGTAFAVTALLAFGLAGDLALTTRFAVFADAVLALEREADRLNPFVRLLLMGGISKGCSPDREQPLESPGEYHT